MNRPLLALLLALAAGPARAQHDHGGHSNTTTATTMSDEEHAGHLLGLEEVKPTSKNAAADDTKTADAPKQPRPGAITLDDFNVFGKVLSAPFRLIGSVVGLVFDPPDPQTKAAIERLVEEGQVTRDDLEAMRQYYSARHQVTEIVQRHLPPGLSSVQQLDELSKSEPARAAEFEARIQRSIATNRGDAVRFDRAAARLEQKMLLVMEQGNRPEPLITALHDPRAHDYPKWRRAILPSGPGAGGASDRSLDDSFVRSFPGAPGPLVFRGQNSMRAGDFQSAARDFARASELDPRSPQTLALYGAALRELGDLPGAARQAERALALDPENKAAQKVYALSAGKGSGPRAGPAQRQAASSAAGETAADSSGGRDAALSLLPQTLPAGPEAREAARHFSLGDYASAQAAAAAALAKNPRNSLARFFDAASKLRSGDAAAALASADAGLALDPRSGALLLAKAQALNRLGRYRDALASARAAAALNPRDATALVASAEALAGLGERDASLAALAQAAALDSRFTPLHEEALASEDLLAVFQGAGAPGTPRAASSAGGGSAPLVLGAGAAGLLLALLAAAFLNKRA